MEQVDALINEANTATTLSGITAAREAKLHHSLSFQRLSRKGQGHGEPSRTYQACRGGT